MANPTIQAFVPAPSEKTFTAYTSEQGAHYAQHRPGYHPNLYKEVLDHHTSTGGQLDTLIDVGCGPGTAARALAPKFTHTIGLDPSEGMISQARSLAGTTSISEPIRFEISTAEDLGWHLTPPVADASVDLITASAAAHWFDMAGFWPAAARVLKPSGTVALWTTGSSKLHPSLPNADKIQAALDELEDRELKPFFVPGNLLTRDLYVQLALPWTLETPTAAFDESTFFRKEWSPGATQDGFFVGGAMTADMDRLEKLIATSSPVQRWREAHPDTVGTERDVVRRMRRIVERFEHEAGVEEGKEWVQGDVRGVLLMIKKKA